MFCHVKRGGWVLNGITRMTIVLIGRYSGSYIFLIDFTVGWHHWIRNDFLSIMEQLKKIWQQSTATRTTTTRIQKHTIPHQEGRGKVKERCEWKLDWYDGTFFYMFYAFIVVWFNFGAVLNVTELLDMLYVLWMRMWCAINHCIDFYLLVELIV